MSTIRTRSCVLDKNKPEPFIKHALCTNLRVLDAGAKVLAQILKLQITSELIEHNLLDAESLAVLRFHVPLEEEESDTPLTLTKPRKPRGPSKNKKAATGEASEAQVNEEVESE